MKSLVLSCALALALFTACSSSDDGSGALPDSDAGVTLDGAPSANGSSTGGGPSTPSGDDASTGTTTGGDGSAPIDAASLPAHLAKADATLASGLYCGKNTTFQAHASQWALASLNNPNNLYSVDHMTGIVSIVGYCTIGCATGSAGHDHCTAPNGAPIAGNECFAGAGQYCGHVLGIQARSYPPGKDHEGLFDCTGQTDVALTTNCDCQVTPGESDACVPATGGRKLYIAYETGTSTCTSQLADFWHCMLEHTNLPDFQLGYGTGYTLSYGAMAQVPGSCGTDYQCVENAANFPLQKMDVLLIVRSGPTGGQNNWDVFVSHGGQNVHVHGAFIGDAGGSCAMQTAYSMHEVYEATSDPGSGDCCDGEVPYTPSGASGCLVWNSASSIACRKWGPASCGGDGSFALSTIKCPNGTYTYQRMSPPDDEYGFTKNQCLPIMVTH